jgi:hypothetical protein
MFSDSGGQQHPWCAEGDGEFELWTSGLEDLDELAQDGIRAWEDLLGEVGGQV